MRPVQLVSLIVLSVLISVLFANVAKIISTDAGLFQTSGANAVTDAGQRTFDSSYVKVVDDSPKELMWFMQVKEESYKKSITKEQQQKIYHCARKYYDDLV